MASNLLKTLEKIEKGRKKCIKLANEVNYPLPEDASLEQIAQCINAQGFADEYYESYKAFITGDTSAVPNGVYRLPDDIEILGPRAFYYKTDVKFIWPRSLKTIGDYAFAYVTFKDGECHIPEGVETLNASCFSNLTNQTISIPSSVTSIKSNAFSSASKGVINYDGRATILNDSAFGNGNNTSGTGWDMYMTPESIACINKINSSVFGGCKLYQVPWNDNTEFEGQSQFKGAIWYTPVNIGANVHRNNAIPNNMFHSAVFTQGATFEEFTATAINSYGFQNSRFNTDKLVFPATITNYGLQCCQSIQKCDEKATSTGNIHIIELRCPENLYLNTQCWYEALYDNMVIHTKSFLNNNISGYMFTRASTSNPVGNIVFLNLTEVPTIASNTFNNNNLTKGNAYVYVPDDLVAEAKAKQYWSTISARIKPLSEWPLYAEYAEHILPREEA